MAGLILTTCVASLEADTTTVTTDSGGTGGPDCTLRDAITAANTDTAAGGCPAGNGADTIELPSASIITLTEVDNDQGDGPNGLPSVTTTVTIHGNGAIVQRDPSDPFAIPGYRVLHVALAGDLTLNQLVVSGGRPRREGDFVTREGGGIYSVGTLTLTDSTVSGNVASGGGGIYNVGTLTLSRTTVSGNFGGSGGGIGNDATMTLADSSISANSARSGGGISNDGTTIISNSTVNGNTANGSPNVSPGAGGGIYNGANGTLTLTNSSVTGNTALAVAKLTSRGGGIWNRGTLSITNSTVNGNTATGNGGGIGSASGMVTLTESIVANNIDGADCAGAVTDGGYNIIEDGSCISAPTSMSGDPNLGPLADNGGATLTHALLPGSIALDAIDDPDACAVGTDQRGVPRPQDLFCDIGAFEQQFAAAPIPAASQWGLGVLTLLVLVAGTIVTQRKHGVMD